MGRFFVYLLLTTALMPLMTRKEEYGLIYCASVVWSFFLTFGERRYVTIQRAAMSSAVLPDHKSIGKKNYNKKNERKYQPI